MAIIFSQLPSFWITLFGWNFKTLNQKWAIGSAIRMARLNTPRASARFPALQPKLRSNVGMRPEVRTLALKAYICDFAVNLSSTTKSVSYATDHINRVTFSTIVLSD